MSKTSANFNDYNTKCEAALKSALADLAVLQVEIVEALRDFVARGDKASIDRFYQDLVPRTLIAQSHAESISSTLETARNSAGLASDDWRQRRS